MTLPWLGPGVAQAINLIRSAMRSKHDRNLGACKRTWNAAARTDATILPRQIRVASSAADCTSVLSALMPKTTISYI
eukprot:8144961-Pyramimonas_sp.AAC.1